MPDEVNQVDVVLAEDCRTVMFIGHIAGNEDHVFLASITMPIALDRSAFLPEEWNSIRNLAWTLH